MKDLLHSQELWEVEENGRAEPENTTNWLNAQMNALRAARKKDKTTLYIMFQEFGFEKIVSAKSSEET